MGAINVVFVCLAVLIATATAKKKSPKLDYIIVCGTYARGPYHLRGAKGALRSCGKKTPRRIRAIFEVRDGVVQTKVGPVGGRKNQGGGKKNGFDKKWGNKQDILAMYQLALRQWVKKRGGTGLPKPGSGKSRVRRGYLIVCERVVRGPYHLNGAKGALRHCAKKNPGRRRAIYEVRNGVLQRDPTRVGGQKSQAGGKQNGFYKYWRDVRDISTMYTTAFAYWKKKNGGRVREQPAPKKRNDKLEYITVCGTNARGPYHLKGAKGALKYCGKKNAGQNRAVFEVRNGVVQRHPGKVGGRRSQAGGKRNGFDKRWRGPGEAGAMYRTALGYWRGVLLKRRAHKPKREYVVVSGKKVRGPYSLRGAKGVLKHFAKNKATRPLPRAIYEVRDGKVQPDPHWVGKQNQGAGRRFGFYRYWRGPRDIKNMYDVARWHWRKVEVARRDGKKPPLVVTRPRKGPEFIVAAGNVVKGPYNLKQAKRVLMRYPRGASKPIRAIYRVHNGKVSKEPWRAAFQNSPAGRKAGFNSYWRRTDMRRMYRIVYYYYISGYKTIEPPPTFDPASTRGPKPKPTRTPRPTRMPTQVPRKEKPNPRRSPKTCSCKTERKGKGQCYYFTDLETKKCQARACAPKYVCVGRYTGVTCIYRKLHSKIVPSGYKNGRCQTEPFSGRMYVPYAQ